MGDQGGAKPGAGFENNEDPPELQMPALMPAPPAPPSPPPPPPPLSKEIVTSKPGGLVANGGSDREGTSRTRDYLRAIGMDPSRFWPKKYRFTREKPTGHFNPLTIGQRNFYEANGYIVFDDCVAKQHLETMRDSHRRTGGVDGELLDRMLTRNEKLLKYVRCFCDDSLMLMTHRLVDSFQPGDMRDVIDRGQEQHQMLSRDWIHLPFRPIDKVCCTVTAIEQLEHALLVVPGTHRIGQCTISSTLDAGNQLASGAADGEDNHRSLQTRELFECSPERLSTLVDKSKKGFQYVDLKPGQMLVYHPGLIHGFSGDLINFRKRQLVSIAYYAAADCEYVDLRHHLTSLDGRGARQSIPPVPVGLLHFEPNKSPLDYTAWLDKPRLIHARHAGL